VLLGRVQPARGLCMPQYGREICPISVRTAPALKIDAIA